MDDRELERLLDSIHRDRARVTVPEGFREHILRAPFRAADGSAWSDGWRTRLGSVIGPPRLAVAGLAAVLVSLTLSAGFLVGRDGGPAPPSAATASSPTPSMSARTAQTAEPSATPEASRGPLTSRGDVLAGVDLLTEVVEPGILRVTSDGVRDLGADPLPACYSLWDRVEYAEMIEPDPDGPWSEISDDVMSIGVVVAGLDDGLWLFYHDRFFRLGDRTAHPWEQGQVVQPFDDFEVAPDHTVWHAPSSGYGLPPPEPEGGNGDPLTNLVDQVLEGVGLGPKSPDEERQAWLEADAERVAADPSAFAMRPGCMDDLTWLMDSDGALRSYRDGSWEVEHQVIEDAVSQVEIGSDDTVWAAWSERGRGNRGNTFVTQQGEAGWLTSGSWSEGQLGTLVADREGSLLLQVDRGRKPDVLWMLQDEAGPGIGSWANLESHHNLHDIALSPNGVLWGVTTPNAITRRDADGWSEWELSEVTDPAGPTYLGGRGGPLAVSLDGAAWLTARRAKGTPGCNGIYRFDGATWSHHLRDRCVRSVDTAPNGTVWLLAGRADERIDLFAVLPDEVRASVDPGSAR